MSELFLTVLSMSLTTSYVIIFVIIMRLLLKKAPKAISYALWGVVALRLIIPFSFESIFSLMPRNTNTVLIPHDIVYQKTPQVNSRLEIVNSFENQTLPATTAGVSVNPSQTYVEIGAYIWILGILTLLCYSFISILILKKQLKNAEFIEKNIYEATNLKTPFVLGIIRPKIYLPSGLNIEERIYILLHEQTHIHRKDHIVKILAFLILSVHWFNPLVWSAFILMSMDMELSCDERVLKMMNKDVKKSYANSLLSLAAGRHILNGSPLAFGEGNIKGRIKNVLNYRKPSFWTVTLTIIIASIISIGLLTNPKKQETIHHTEDSITYGIVSLVKNDSQYLIPPLLEEGAKLAKEIIIDSLLKSTIYEGIDINDLDEYYLLRATYNDGKVSDYYTFIYNGRTVLQRGESGYYTFINDELYKKLVDLVNNQQPVSNEHTIKPSDYIVKSSNLNNNDNELIESDIADILLYTYNNRSIKFIGLEIFNEFGTEEFGYVNEGVVSINSNENVLEFYIIYYTGPYIGSAASIPGPDVYFKMNLDTNEIIEKEFTPAPNYAEDAELYPEYIEPESIKYSEKTVELNDERMAEIGEYFKNYIFDIEDN